MFLKNIIFKSVMIILSISTAPSYAKWWGSHCKINPLPDTKFCFFCREIQGEWEEWNIDPYFDDILAQHGWKPKQVSLAIRLFLRHQIQDDGSIAIHTRAQRDMMYLFYELLTRIEPFYSLDHFNEVRGKVSSDRVATAYPEMNLGSYLTNNDFHQVCHNKTYQCLSDQVRDPYTDRCAIDCNENGRFDSGDSTKFCSE